MDPVRRSSHILISGDDVLMRHRVMSVLKTRPYVIQSAQTADAVLQRVHDRRVDLLIVPEKVGVYGGVQLVRAARGIRPEIGGLVVTPEARPLESDAGRYRVALAQMPFDGDEFLMAVAQLIAAAHRQQRWPRKIVTSDVPLLASGWAGRLLDVSYGGMKMQLMDADAGVPARMVVDLPTAGLEIEAEVVWSAQGADGWSSVCGAAVTDEPASVPDWCRFVDQVC